MSGGRWQYLQDSLCSEMFPYWCDYGESGHKYSQAARSANPMCDREISELVWDVLCLIHSCDWMRSGDTDEDTYREDVKWFKKKWLKRTNADVINAYKADLREYADELIKEMDTIFNGTKENADADKS